MIVSERLAAIAFPGQDPIGRRIGCCVPGPDAQKIIIGVAGDIANTGNSNNAGFYEHLNLVGDPHLDHPSTGQWFNTKAFAVPANFTYGNFGRNRLRSDWGKNLDLSLFRDFPIREAMRLQFRAEAFNLTNTPVWGTPVLNYSNANFGRVLGVGNTPRQVQFALKLYF